MKFIDHSKEAMRIYDKELGRRLDLSGEIIRGNVLPLIPVDTGNLKNSYTWVRTGLELIFGTNVLYAIHVELGTERMSALPHLVPGFEASIRKIKRLFQK